MATPANVTEIKSKAQFDELIRTTPYVALQAHAAWCGPCKAITPIFGKHAAEHHSDKYAFARFDTDDVPDLSFELGIRSIPAFFTFENADKGESLVGASPPALKKLVDGLAAKAGGESESAAPAPTPAPAAAAEEKKEEVFSTNENF